MYLNGRKIISINKMPKPIQNKTVSPSKNQQNIEADTGYELGTVTILPVTSGIDSEIQAGNIKKGVEILGVEGTYEPTGDIQDPVTVNPSTSPQTVTPGEGYSGLSSVIVNAIDDTNLIPENIKKGTSILGVTGTMIDDNYSKLVDRSVKNIYEENLHDCTEIGEYAFDRCYNLTKIVIPDNILTIKNYAFTTCYKLAEIYNLSALTVTKGSSDNGDLAKYALVVHTSLNEPSILTTDNNGFVFAYVNNQGYLVRYDGDLSRITLPSSFTYQNNTITSYKINKGAFEYSTITEVTIPNNVTYIDDHAFENCTSLATVNIGSGVTYIGENAFKNCTALTTITIPNNVFTIEAGAFEGCNALESMILPFIGKEYYTIEDEGNTTTFKYIFGSTVPTSLTSVEITNIDYVQPNAFGNLSNLEEIIIPDEVEYIGNSAFYGCSSLEEFDFPYNLEEAGTDVFRNCLSLTNVNLSSTNLMVLNDGIFRGCSNLQEIILQSGTTSIGNNAFSACASLEEISIPGTVTSIGDAAFRDCVGLTDITIPNSVLSIGSQAFSGCTSLEDMVLPFIGQKRYTISSTGTLTTFKYIFGSTVPTLLTSVEITNIDYVQPNAFSECFNLESITIPSTVSSIGSKAFYRCRALKSINLSSLNLTVINDYTFSECESLQTVLFPSNTLAKIGKYAFSYCSSLANITIPSTVNIIDNYAFLGCSSITSITIPDNVIDIYEGSFNYCEKLKNITFGANTKSIQRQAFKGCRSLTSIVIPSTITSIVTNAFSGCYNLVEIYNLSQVSMSNVTSLATENVLVVHTSLNEPSIISENENNGFAFAYYNSKYYLIGYYGESKSISLPSTFTYKGTSGLTNDYKLIEYLFFESSITSVVIPSIVSEIGANSFRDCTSLTNLTLSNGNTKIKENAFYGCTSLTNFTIPNSVTSIEDSAFYGCTSLTSITIPGATVVSDSSVFRLCTSLETVVLSSGVTRIVSGMFRDCTSLTSITIPNTVTSIGNNAFNNCTNLSSITIPSSVTSIDSRAFMDCTALNSITIPSGVTSLGNSIFSGCTNLSSVTFLNALTEITSYMFENCVKITSITIPSTVTSIGNYAFYGIGITSITIPSTVTSMGNNILANCKNLTSVTVSSTQGIPKNMVLNCVSLVSFNLPNNTMNALIDRNAFTGTPIETGSGYIYVNSGLVNDYKNASNWNYYAGNITAIQS